MKFKEKNFISWQYIPINNFWFNKRRKLVLTTGLNTIKMTFRRNVYFCSECPPEKRYLKRFMKRLINVNVNVYLTFFKRLFYVFFGSEMTFIDVFCT